MNASENNLDELLLLMNQALETCVQLRKYSDENYNVFQHDDDEKIFEVINNREKIIESLFEIEYKIDALLDEGAESAHASSISDKVHELRLSIREILNDVAARDMEIMQAISGKMQLYKNEILKARNKKNLAAYMRNSAIEAYGDGDNVDVLK